MSKEYKVNNPWWAQGIKDLHGCEHTRHAPPLETVDPSAESVQFGANMKKSNFMLSDDITFLNHGSYGAVLRPVLKYQRAMQDLLEFQPVKFMEDIALPEIAATLKDLSDFVHCDPDEVVFVRNATSGCNAVIKSFDYEENDVILTLSLCYDAVRNALDFAVTERKNVVHAHISLPISDEDILAELSRVIEQVQSTGRNIKLAVVDHITSMPARIMPVKEMIAICHDHNIPVHVDGAHAVGQIALNLHDLDADFYTSNCHKWLCSGKGVAFLYAKREWHKKIYPSTTSHGYELGFASEFYWPGTFDPSAQLGVAAALKFYNDIGPERIASYCHDLVVRAGEKLMDSWGTTIVLADADHAGTLYNVQVPDNVLSEAGPKDSREFHDLLRDRYHIECPTMMYDGHLFIRLSAQMYNQFDDYLVLEKAVHDIIASH